MISRYLLSNRRYIEIIADIFRVVFDIFEKSLIYLVGNPPRYPGPTQFQINKTKKRPAQQGASFIYYPVPAARMFGGFTSSYEAKSASTSEAPSPSHSERAASTLNINQ
ncbi:hypothetical protein AB893_25440 [Bacillus anthracis]|nr:hypothetical protein TM00_25455 [Bacillus anthracis]AJZ69336.1 hypothetical protein A16R_60560 [Bacillus anthracis str. A16R]AJZ69556.2 hypothetical protein A16_59570 [Bacillus anthracis str. A16]AJM83438.1 hypothetical protein KD35_26675 [Bacillus anthracis]ALC37039.1 hypothetical protein AB893_25440 [Bacillus anthracis]